MKNKDKKYIKLFLWVAFLFSFWVFNVLAVVDTPIKVNPEDGTNFVNETTYTLLAPFGDSLKTIDTTNIADYFNLMIKIFIGLCAVLAVVMIVVYGIQYMGTDSIFSKSKAKERIGEAILGLLIALGSYAILNTINPDLTEIRLNVGKVAFLVDFDVPASFTYDGRPVKINFNKEAYPAAKYAEEKTGIDAAFILAIFGQETGSGRNTGSCNYQTANMKLERDLEPLKKIAERLKMDWKTINMSCSGGGSTYGGAIGYTQFLPSTWEENRGTAAQYLGHEPNPWNVDDALMMTAVYLQRLGASSSDQSQIDAACRYFGSCDVIVSCGSGVSGTYGQCVLAKKKSIREQINQAISKGEIQP